MTVRDNQDRMDRSRTDTPVGATERPGHSGHLPPPVLAAPAARRRPRRAPRAEPPSFREQAWQALRQEGYRVTQQRDSLLDVIERASGHLDADGIYRLARERDHRISLSTVYRTLSLLKRHRLVHELHLSEEHHHYEARSAEHGEHYHLVCTQCGAVQEVPGELLDQFRAEVRERFGFAVAAIQLDVVGRCAACEAPAGQAS